MFRRPSQSIIFRRCYTLTYRDPIANAQQRAVVKELQTAASQHEMWSHWSQFSLCVHYATPELCVSQIRPRQIMLFDGLFHGMQQELLFISWGTGRGSLWQIIIYVVSDS